LQAKINSESWTTIATVETQVDGRFEYNWAPVTGGVIAIEASWLGTDSIMVQRALKQTSLSYQYL